MMYYSTLTRKPTNLQPKFSEKKNLFEFRNNFAPEETR